MSEALLDLQLKLESIVKDQQRKRLESEVTNIGGIIASRDKHEALGLILDYLGPDIEQVFEEIK